MSKITCIAEQFQHFVRELKESFWGELYGETKLAWKGTGRTVSAVTILFKAQ